MKIISVVTLPEHGIAIHFDDSRSIKLDMKRKLHTIRFGGLRDEAVFHAAGTDGKSVHWPGGVIVSISEILEMARDQ